MPGTGCGAHQDALQTMRSISNTSTLGTQPPPSCRPHLGAKPGPVSTTHVLSSGVAGTMAANRSGLQMSTIRNLLMAWVLTLPAAILLSGTLYWLFTLVF